VAELIRPQLEQGSIVICDRFFDASLAYQGYGHELDLDALRAITLFATAGLIPDLTFLLDLPVEQGLIRREQDGQWNRLDAYDVAFHRRVRAGYLQLAAADPSRWVVIDAAQPPEPIHETIMEAALTRIRSTPH
jgi:dTMP kinase